MHPAQSTSLVSTGLLVSLLSAIAILGILIYQNRSEIARINDWAFGHDRGDGGGADTEVRAVSEQLDSIETKLDREQAHRMDHHDATHREIEINRYLTLASLRNLAEILEEEADIEFDAEDIRPDWVSEDVEDLFDGGPDE